MRTFSFSFVLLSVLVVLYSFLVILHFILRFITLVIDKGAHKSLFWKVGDKTMSNGAQLFKGSGVKQ